MTTSLTIQDRKTYTDLARAITFMSDNENSGDLLRALQENPNRFDYTDLEKITEGKYQLNLTEVDTGKSHDLPVQDEVMKFPWVTPLVREANERFSGSLENALECQNEQRQFKVEEGKDSNEFTKKKPILGKINIKKR